MTSACKVDRALVLHLLGCTGASLGSGLDERLDAAVERCERIAQPKSAWRLFKTRASRDCIEVVGTSPALAGSRACEQLAGSRGVALLVCTLGDAFDREQGDAAQLAVLDQLMLDAAASSLVQVLARSCRAEIARAATSRGLFAGAFLEPGCSGIPLDVQPGLLRALDAQRMLGVSCTAYGNMVPSKSLTAIVGLFDEEHADNSGCENCSFSTYCELKKRGVSCTQ
ncbi:MAG: hypothetical protein PUC67_04770 [Coriobacteriaceae bacterium]|nr:hypothetical protein [Coriobacteriaceae bacterium]